MAAPLGTFYGLEERESDIKKRRQLIEDREAAGKEWKDRFDLQNKSAWDMWSKQNEITNRQQMERERLSAERSAKATLSDRQFQLDLLKLKRIYEKEDKSDAKSWWKEQQDILFEKAEQKAENDQGRLEAWDNAKFDRDQAAYKQNFIDQLGLKSEEAKKQFDYEFTKNSDAAKQTAIAKHANEMQKLLLERVMDGKAIGADFTAAVGGTSDPYAQIAQYSAGITALGVAKDNPTLAKLAGLNNPAVMKSAFDTLQKYHQKIVESGQTGTAAIEMFREGANEYFSNLQITSPDPAQADKLIKQMETVLGKPLDSITKSLVKSSVGTTGSAIAVVEPTLVEPLDVSKLGDWKEVITENAVSRARNEQTRLSKAKTSVNQLAKSSDPEEKALAEKLMDWLSERDLVVTEALDAVKNKDYYGVTSLFGNSSIKEAIKAEPKLESAVLPDYIKNAKDAEPVVVQSRQVLIKLIEYGIIQPGDLVTYPGPDGTMVTLPYSGE